MIRFAITTILLIVCMFSLSAQNGNLVIVGGALSPDNEEVYREFINLAGGSEKAKIAIVPGASGAPAIAIANFTEDMIKYGLGSEQIYGLQLATEDDKSTKNVDESRWSKNGDSDELVKIIDQCTGVWFTGGDQLRTTEILMPRGKDSKVLAAIRQVYARGGVIGGSSAGAAIMSEIMIGRGTSFGALSNQISQSLPDDSTSRGELYLTHGIGFFKSGIVDQHFDKRARLGRLIKAVDSSHEKVKLGFGVDENTAMVYYSKNKQIKALGEGGITIVDFANSNFIADKPYFTADTFLLSYISKGDIYHLQDKSFTPNPLKKSTLGKEYIQTFDPIASGVLSSYNTLTSFITYNLVDNARAQKAVSYNFNDSGFGFALEFIQTTQTQGFYTSKPDRNDHYMATNIKTVLKPVNITINPIR